MAVRTRSRKNTDLGSLLQQGEALRQEGQYAKSQACLRRALQTSERSYGKRHLHTAIALNSLGVLYKYMGRFAESGRVYRRALRIVEQVASESQAPELVDFLASLYHNLGGLEHARGRCAKGEPWARRSVEMRRNVRDEGDPVLAADEAALAALLDGQGKYGEAENLYQRVLATFEKHFGPEHYEVAVNLNNLAALHQLRGEPDQALPLYRRALAIKEKILGRRHPDTAITLHNLALLLWELGQLKEADRCLRRSLSILRTKFSPQHPQRLAAERSYLQVHRRRLQKKA